MKAPKPGLVPTSGVEHVGGSSAGRELKSYLGQIATRSAVPTRIDALCNHAMARTRHIACDDIAWLKLAYAGWYADYAGDGETPVGRPTQVRASIEYPAGVFVPVTWGGAFLGVIPSGENLVSDALDVRIPRGAAFHVRVRQSSAGGILYCDHAKIGDHRQGEAFIASSESVPDLTGGGDILDGGKGQLGLPPAAIISQTQKPSAFIAGDSRAAGFHDMFDADHGDKGEIARSIGPGFAYVNAAVPGEWLHRALMGYANRFALSLYCSHIMVNYGVNDLYNLRTAAEVLAELETLYSGFGRKPIVQTTILPVSHSTDFWETVENQTHHQSDAERVAVNRAIRGGIQFLSGFVDNADAVENERDGGRWKVTGAPFGFTKDGLHPNFHAYREIQLANAEAFIHHLRSYLP